MSQDRRATFRTVSYVLLVVGIVAIVAFVVVAPRERFVWDAHPGRIGAPSEVFAIDPVDPDDPPDIHLAVVGDVGTGEPDAWATANLVAEAAKREPVDALILLGDNVYPNGDPDRLDATVFQPFGPVLDQGTDLLAVLGNHDVRDGNGPRQAEALGMPNRWYATQIGSVLFIGLDSTLIDSADQTNWLEETLAATDSAWVIVGMHHPAYSAGYHGSTEAVIDQWVPILERHNVDLVVAGHDHDYQRSTVINGVTYIVSGAGAKTRLAGKAAFTAYSASVLHFVDIKVWDDRIEAIAISTEGVFDRVTLDAPSAGY